METLPTYMAQSDSSDGAAWSLDDTTLRVGEVVNAFPPNVAENKDPSTKGKQWVYVVNVAYRDADGARSLVPYRCTVVDLFGSLADHCRHSVRAAEGQTKAAFSNGAQVLVLCPNGDKSQALIVGGVRHRDEKTSDPSTFFFDFLFNGVHVAIDKDGALQVQVPGATKFDGTPGERDSNNHGSQVTFAKDGTITVDDQNGQRAILDPGGQKVEVHGKKVTVFSGNIQFGDDGLTEEENGVVVADGIDTFTGLTYFELDNTSKKVKAKR